MATKQNPVKVTDTRTMETKEFANAKMALSYLESPTIMPKLDLGGNSNYAKKIAEKIVESTNTAGSAMESVDSAPIDYRENGDSKTTFKNGGEREAAAGGTLDQVASEYAEDKFTPTGVWEYDLGYALGRSRKKKIDAAGGKEAFKAAKQEKRSARQIERKQSRAIAKERKSFKPMNKMSVIEPRSLPTRSKKHELFNKK